MAAQKQTEPRPDREELIRQLINSRARLARDLEGMVYELDVKSKVKRSVAHNAATWVAGAAASGFILAMLPGKKRRKGKSQKLKPSGESGSTESRSKTKRHKFSESLLFDSVKTMIPVLRPLLIAVVSKKVGALAAKVENRNP